MEYAASSEQSPLHFPNTFLVGFFFFVSLTFSLR